MGKEGEWTIVTEQSMDAGTHKLKVSTRRMYIFKGRDENIVVDKTNLPKKDQKEKNDSLMGAHSLTHRCIGCMT